MYNYQPTVSVILCNYNYGRFIGQAIESVLGQTYSAFELIIVDDGSTDDSRIVIQSYDDPRITTILQENGGQAAAFNAGLSRCSGELISFIDSDDIWKRTKLEKVVAAFSGNDVVVVQHNLEIMDLNGKAVPGGLYPGIAPGLVDVSAQCVESGRTNFFGSTSGLSMTALALKNLGRICEKWRICADVPLTRPLAFMGNVYTLDEALGYYRIHSENGWTGSTAYSEQKVRAHYQEREAIAGVNRFLETQGDKRRMAWDASSLDSIAVQQDENRIIHEYLGAGFGSRVMVDVGAHQGGSSAPFLLSGWHVHAFEPDDKNREVFLSQSGKHNRLRVDSRAVSSASASAVPFYVSDISTGISGLSAFDESHQCSGTVTTVTLREYCEEMGVEQIDYLKIDTEGFDLKVLEGAPWEAISPSCILCEFENTKTQPLGYSFSDLADFLVARGYELIISEWFPIVAYGGTHSWRRFSSYPCSLVDENGWGNIMAFHGGVDVSRFMTALAYSTMPQSGTVGSCFEVTSLQDSIQYMTSSFSWRLTRPLREARRLARSLKHKLVGVAKRS